MRCLIILTLLNLSFMGLTMFWGAWYSLAANNPRDFKATFMPIILAGPRCLLLISSLLVGLYVLKWTTGDAILFTMSVMGGWILLITSEIMYVQSYLRKKQNG